jgi:hypothetical protein
MESIDGPPGPDELALLALLPADGGPADGTQILDALCDLTGVSLSYPGRGGATVSVPPGYMIANSGGFRLGVDADTGDVTINVTGVPGNA